MKKKAKNDNLYPAFCQKTLFEGEKSFNNRSSWSKKFSRSEKISSHGNFTLSPFQAKPPSERIKPPVKKKPIFPFES